MPRTATPPTPVAARTRPCSAPFSALFLVILFFVFSAVAAKCLRLLLFAPSLRSYPAMANPFQLAAGNALPELEFVGPTGYVRAEQFDLGLPVAPATRPSIRIDNLRWFKYIMSYLGVEEVGSETFEVIESTAWRSRVDFSIPGLGHAGIAQEMSVFGIRMISPTLAEKYGIEAAIKMLRLAGHDIPSYSSLVVQAIDDFSSVEHLCLANAQANIDHLVEDRSMTYAGCSFEAILNQIMEKGGYVWRYASVAPVLTTEEYQAKLVAAKRQTIGRPSLTVVSRPCGRPAEATESVLCTALGYIDDVCSCRIGDIDYAKCFQRRFRLHNPGVLPADA